MATKDKIVNLEDLKVLSDHVEGEVTDLKSDLDSVSEHKNIYDKGSIELNNVTYQENEGTLTITAIKANTYSSIQYKNIDISDTDSITVTFSDKTGQLRIGEQTGDKTTSWLGWVSESPTTFDVTDVENLVVGMYVKQSATVEAGQSATFVGVVVAKGSDPVYYPANTAIDRESRTKVELYKTELLEKCNNLFEKISERIDSVIDIYSATFTTSNSASVTKNENDITVTDVDGKSYSYATFLIDVSDINTLYFDIAKTSGNGDAGVRIAEYNGEVFVAWKGWFDLSGSVDVSEMSKLGFALYAEKGTNASVGQYVTYSDITLSSKPIQGFTPTITAVDVVARNKADSVIVPSYYDEYIDEKIARINELAKSTMSNGDAFVFITDAHWVYNAKQSPKLLKDIYQKTHINKLFCGGDMSNSKTNDDTYFEVGSTLRNAWSGEAHYAMGNHEYLGATNGEITTEDNLYYYYRMYAENENGSANRHYYYFDNDRQKIRYVFLNKYAESTNDGASAGLGYEQDQINWFTGIALAVETGWTIVIVTHNIFNIVPDASYNITESIPSNSQPIYDAIANYSGNGTIAAVICGHAHLDYVTRIGNVPCIITTCDKNKSGGEATPDAATWAAIWSARKSGTIYEQAFDVMILDKENRKITAVRIGYPSTVENGGTAVEEREVTY